MLPRTRILVVTVNEDSAVAHEALREWASGYLLKKSAAAELTYAIREILSGKSYVAPSVAKKLTEDFIRDPVTRTKGSRRPVNARSSSLLAEGRTMKEAANVLNLTTQNSCLPQVQNHGRLRHAQQLGTLQTGHTRASGLYELNSGASISDVSRGWNALSSNAHQNVQPTPLLMPSSFFFAVLGGRLS